MRIYFHLFSPENTQDVKYKHIMYQMVLSNVGFVTQNAFFFCRVVER